MSFTQLNDRVRQLKKNSIQVHMKIEIYKYYKEKCIAILKTFFILNSRVLGALYLLL